MEQITLQFTGTAALLMHNNVTVNPLDPKTKEIKKLTGERKKTDEIHLMIQRLEWEAGLYHDSEVGPYIPAVNVEICLRDAAKMTKQGASVTRSVVIPQDKLPLEYDGPRGNNGKGLQELYEANYKDYRVVGNQQNSIMRCRPKFPGPFERGGPWKLTVPLVVETSILNLSDLRDIAMRAGQMIGLGDYRPRFGRFEVS